MADRNAMPPKDYQTLKGARIVDRERRKDFRPISDDRNIFVILFAASRLRYRSQSNQLPPNILVN